MSEVREAKGVSLAELAWTCLYIGLTGYGGPAIVGHMKRVFVERKKWITEQEFITGLSLSQLLPSATGANTIEFLGYRIRGSLGAIVAPVCFILPALILMTILSAIYFRYGQVPLGQALFTGLGAVVIALIISAAVSLGRSAIKDVWAAVVAVVGLALVELLHQSIPMVVVVSAIAGFLIYRGKITPEEEPQNGSDADDMPRIFWLWLGIAILAVTAVLVLTRGYRVTELLTSILHVGAFTFGGGFMSIPIFQHQAVDIHHWLTTRQFLDGIALGQITPGPVLITAVFIGYKVLGVWGALLAGLTIFSPGALGMFVVAHQHEKVSHLVWLQAMVKGIVAGFMGVLVSVIIRLGAHSLTDWKTVTLAVAALVALLVAKLDPLWVIIAGAAVSLVLFT